MTTTTLTLFDLAALNPEQPTTCQHCGDRPATTRVYAVQNLLGIHPTWMTSTWYRDAVHRAHSGPCCDQCAWYLASSWWNPVYACPDRGPSCHLWAHTLTEPRPGWDCGRHHREDTVVWSVQLEVSAA